MKATGTKRESNLELLRIVAMSMIVIHHFIVHILWPAHPTSGSNEPVLAFFNVLFICGVNLFVMISGYFQIKLSWRSMIRLWLFIVFFIALTLVAYQLYALQYDLANLSWKQFLLPFTIFSKSGYWFLGSYFALMLFSPVLNAAQGAMSLRTMRQSMLLLTFFTCYSSFLLGNSDQYGYGIFHFIYLYLAGYYVRQEPWFKRIRGRVYLIVFFSICVVYGLFAAWLVFRENLVTYNFKLFGYNNPVVLITTLCLFCFFIKLKLKSRFINRIAESILGVYLLQESRLGYILYGKMEVLFQQSGFTLRFFGLLLLTFLALFCVAFLLNLLRKKICNPLENYIILHIPQKLHLNFDERH